MWVGSVSVRVVCSISEQEALLDSMVVGKEPRGRGSYNAGSGQGWRTRFMDGLWRDKSLGHAVVETNSSLA